MNIEKTVMLSACYLHAVYMQYMCRCVWLFMTPWTVAHQTPLSMGFPKPEYWSESSVNLVLSNSLAASG